MSTTLTSNLIIPEVVSGLIDSNLGDGITLLPLAEMDDTLVGQPGDTLKFPVFAYIGNAAVNDLQARYYVPNVSGGMLTWQPTADDMPSVPASPVGGGSGLLFVRVTADEEGNFSSDLPYAAIEQAVQGGQMAYAVIENAYYLPLIGLAENTAIFSIVASLFDSMTVLTAIITADGSVVIQGV